MSETLQGLRVNLWEASWRKKKGKFKYWIAAIVKYKAVDYKRKFFNKKGEILPSSIGYTLYISLVRNW